MNKDFKRDKYLSFDEQKQLKILYDLALFIEKNQSSLDSTHFLKLTRYHEFLQSSDHENIKILNKEFYKIKKIDYQFQLYLMYLERFLGQSKKEYDFIITTKDNNNNNIKNFSIICLLDSVRSAHNVGAFFRNAECFGIESIILTGLSPTPEIPQVIKTAMGTDKLIPWTYEKKAIESIKKLKEKNYQIWSIETEATATYLNELRAIPDKIVLVFGHEQFGIAHDILELSDKIVSIELFGRKNSLNVSISQGIVLQYLTNCLQRNSD